MFKLGAGRGPAAPSAHPYHEWFLADGTLWTSFHRTPQGYLLCFPGIADFEVDSGGRQVTAWPVEGVARSTVDHIYRNQVLPLAWSKQGRLVLHASAVEVDGRALAFIARSGQGKSTLAASFVAAGARLLCDDALVIEIRADRLQAQPGPPSLRLWRDSEEALVREGFGRAPQLPFTSKGRFEVLDPRLVCQDTCELAGAFFLGDGSAPSAELDAMRGSEAFAQLVKHSFLLDTEEQGLLSTHFNDASRLAGLATFHRLDYPRRYERLPEVREAVLQHV